MVFAVYGSRKAAAVRNLRLDFRKKFARVVIGKEGEPDFAGAGSGSLSWRNRPGTNHVIRFLQNKLANIHKNIIVFLSWVMRLTFEIARRSFYY